MSLSILDFSLFFMQKLQHPTENGHPVFLSNATLKIEVQSSPPLFENLVRGSVPPSGKCGGGVGAHYDHSRCHLV